MITTTATVEHHRSATMTVDIDGEELSFDVTPGLAPEPWADVYVGRRMGGGWHLSWLVADEGCTEEPWQEGVGWCEVSDYYGRNSAYDLVRTAIAEHGRNHVFLVHYFDDRCRGWYSLTDTIADAGFVLTIPSDVTDPQGFAEAVVAERHAWAQGEVFGVISCEVLSDGSVSDPDGVWGYIGTDYAEQEAQWAAMDDEATAVSRVMAGWVR